MTLRPAWLAVAFATASALHLAAFIQFSRLEERGEAPSGDEGILVALGTPAQTGASGQDPSDQGAGVEPPGELAEAAPDQAPTPDANAAEADTIEPEAAGSNADTPLPEATAVELPVESPQEVADEDPPNPVEPETQTATAQEPGGPEPQQPGEATPDDPPEPVQQQGTAEPPAVSQVETAFAALPLPGIRPEPSPQAAPHPQPPASTQGARNPEPRRSSGAVTSGNSANEAPRARDGGGNAAERADYLSRLHAQLVRSKRYPSAARRDGVEGVVQIGMTVNREGRITVFRITRGSGFEVLDEEVRNMIARVQPLPRMPASMELSQITINMAIRFKLE